MSFAPSRMFVTFVLMFLYASGGCSYDRKPDPTCWDEPGQDYGKMLWFHLPIVDVSIPDERFEEEWDVAGEKLRSMLRRRLDVLVHCRGGLGRAGTIAARLLVELGMEPTKAIASVRAVRPGAIETPDQEKFVLGISTARQ